jgi:hypothetical protein
MKLSIRVARSNELGALDACDSFGQHGCLVAFDSLTLDGALSKHGSFDRHGALSLVDFPPGHVVHSNRMGHSCRLAPSNSMGRFRRMALS